MNFMVPEKDSLFVVYVTATLKLHRAEDVETKKETSIATDTITSTKERIVAIFFFLYVCVCVFVIQTIKPQQDKANWQFKERALCSGLVCVELLFAVWRLHRRIKNRTGQEDLSKLFPLYCGVT